MENTVRRRGLVAEHGLSLWVECEDGPILFDAGQTAAWRQNAERLGIDVSAARAVVLSHGHYDHGGGIPEFPFGQRGVPLYVHPKAFLPRYARSAPDRPATVPIGLEWRVEQIEAKGGHIVMNEGTTGIGRQAYVLADIPRVTPYEPAPWEFESEGADGLRRPDRIDDEQLLVLDLPDGLAVILGCSHPGLVNCLLRVMDAFPGRRIAALIGGTHLEKADGDRLRETASFLDGIDIPILAPLHCTGARTQCGLFHALGERVRWYGTGDRLDL